MINIQGNRICLRTFKREEYHQYWKFYVPDLIELAINYVFNTLKLKKIYADTMGSNLKMQRIFDKFGFEFINREEHFYDMHDRWEDKLNYGLINEEVME